MQSRDLFSKRVDFVIISLPDVGLTLSWVEMNVIVYIDDIVFHPQAFNFELLVSSKRNEDCPGHFITEWVVIPEDYKCIPEIEVQVLVYPLKLFQMGEPVSTCSGAYPIISMLLSLKVL